MHTGHCYRGAVHYEISAAPVFMVRAFERLPG